MNEAQRLKLLLVEDEPTQRLLLERLLRRAGYEVETAPDGESALERVATGEFQMLLTDRDMPGIDGATLCRQVRELTLPTYVYILLLTAQASIDDVVTGLESGADDYIRKPANEAELLARLNAGRRIVQLEQSLREANAKIQLLSITDALVGTFNRRYLNEQLPREVERARRYDHAMSVVMTDLDQFKKINDEYGHQVGDEVLRQFAALSLGSIRNASDWIARFGGEEFVIVLPQTTAEGAAAVAEKIRGRCASQPFATSMGEILVTASFGVATLSDREESAQTAAEALLRRADDALYRSKREGRNRVVIVE